MPQDAGNIHKLKDKIDFKTISFMQINRCLQLITLGDRRFIHSVNGLENLLSKYKDERYNNEIASIDQWIKDKEWDAKVQKKDYGKDIEDIHFEAARKKLDALMRIADTAGLLPEEGVEDYI